MKVTQFSKEVTLIEGKKESISIAQVNEVLKIVNDKLNGQLYDLINSYTGADTIFYELSKNGKPEINIAFKDDKVIGIREDYKFLMGKTFKQVIAKMITYKGIYSIKPYID